MGEAGRDQPVAARGPDPGLGELRGLADPTATPNAAGLTSGFDMSPGVARPLWPGRAIRVETHAQACRGIYVFLPLPRRRNSSLERGSVFSS